MQKNVGQTDRMVRIIAGVIILLLGLVFESWWGIIGVIPLATGALSWCPAYIPFGISTCKTDGKGGKPA